MTAARHGEIPRDLVAEVQCALAALGIAGIVNTLGGKARIARGVRRAVVPCVLHDDRTPSLSVTVADGRILWRCFGACDRGGDGLDLVAASRGLSRRDFRRVLTEAAVVAGRYDLVRALDAAEPARAEATREQPERPAPRPSTVGREPERDYPPAHDVAALLDACGPVDADGEVTAWLRKRGLRPERVAGAGVAFALRKDAPLPAWAACNGKGWIATGHRLVFPMHDAAGRVRTVRAARIVDGETPKRAAPRGHRVGGVVLACELAIAMLRGTFAPRRVLVVEGEPDFLAWTTATGIAAHARIGVISGAWTNEIASRVPDGAEVIVRTHADEAGERYARAVIGSLAHRCEVHRLAAEDAA